MQDGVHLGHYARVLSLAAARARESATWQAFANSALGAVAVEQALHTRYLREFGVDPASVMAAEPAPDCLAYTSFLLATAYQEPWEIQVAALLPCFWIYWDVAQAIPPAPGSTRMPTRISARRSGASSASRTRPRHRRHRASETAC